MKWKGGATKAFSEPVFIALSVVFVVGTWAQNVAVIGWVSKFCRLYILVWREFWTNLFVWAKDWVKIDLLDYQLDLLTLITTIAAVSGLVPMIVSAIQRSVSKGATGRDGPELDIAAKQSKGSELNLVTWLLVALSILFIAFPFFHSFSIAVDITGDLQNELQVKYADSSETPDASWFERLIFATPGVSSETLRFLNYWIVPIQTLSLIIAVLMRTQVGLIAILSGLISTAAAYAIAVWCFGSLYSPQMKVVMINTALCAALGVALGIGLRHSARSFIYIATFAVLVMAADLAINAISRTVDSVERSAAI